MEDDDEAQINEFLALKSIYTDDAFQEHSQDGATNKQLRSGALLVSVDHSSPVYVCSSQTPDTKRLVKYLPPIMLRFILPEDYPSSNAPHFTILCPWLSKEQIASLSAELDRLWIENACTVVLYTWASFLQTCALDVLSLTSGPVNVSSDSILHHVLQYNNDQSNYMFSKSYITCLVCMLERPGSASMKFPSCEHAFCRECMASYFESLIDDGSVRRLNCPHEKCDTEATAAQVKELVSKEAFERYDSLLLKKAVNAMKDINCCPRTSCGHPVVRDLGGVGTCQSCLFVFCFKCRREYHHLQPCARTEEELVLRSIMLYSSEKGDISWMSQPTSFTFDYSAPGSYVEDEVRIRPNVETKYGQGEWERLIDEGYSHTFMLKLECRPCPSCDTPIQKNGGCSHMHCSNCDFYFCWECLAALKNDISGHSHNKKNMDQIKQGVYGNWSHYT